MKAPVALLLFVSFLAPHPSQASASLPESLAENDQHFASYETARSLILQAMRSARYRVVLVTQTLTDGDVATALHSLVIRNIFVQVMLDRQSISSYNSRHTYLQSAQIPIFIANLKSLRNRTRAYVVVDNTAFRISAPFRADWNEEVTIGPAPFHAGEIVSLFSSVPLMKPLPEGAKTPTRIEPAPLRKSDTISYRAHSMPGSKAGPLPRRLPKATRLQEINAGRTSGDEQIRPVRELQDGILSLENESELTED